MINSVVNNNKCVSTIQYPKLMTHKNHLGIIFLMFNSSQGTVLNGPNIGEQYTHLNIQLMSDFNCTITLNNF